MTVKIDQAFTSALLNGGLAVDIVHENGVYSVWGGAAYSSHLGVYQPTNGRPFIEEKTFISDRSAYSLADSDEVTGLYQAIIKYPADAGAISAKTKVDAVSALFPIGSTITYSGQGIEIMSSRHDGGRNDGGFYQIVFRANFRAFLAR